MRCYAALSCWAYERNLYLALPYGTRRLRLCTNKQMQPMWLWHGTFWWGLSWFLLGLGAAARFVVTDVHFVLRSAAHCSCGDTLTSGAPVEYNCQGNPLPAFFLLLEPCDTGGELKQQQMTHTHTPTHPTTIPLPHPLTHPPPHVLVLGMLFSMQTSRIDFVVALRNKVEENNNVTRPCMTILKGQASIA